MKKLLQEYYIAQALKTKEGREALTKAMLEPLKIDVIYGPAVYNMQAVGRMQRMKQPRAPKFRVGQFIYSQFDKVCGDVLSWKREKDGYFYTVSLYIAIRQDGEITEYCRRHVVRSESVLTTKAQRAKSSSWDQERV